MSGKTNLDRGTAPGQRENSAPPEPGWKVQLKREVADLPVAEQMERLRPTRPMANNTADTSPVQMCGDGDQQEEPQVPEEDLSLATAKKILDDSYSDLHTFVEGSIQVLEQDAFQVKYDSIYAPDYAWDTYVIPTFGNLEGFAHEGTNYINKALAHTDTVVHEMLHNNTAADFVAVVGDEFNEGTTEILTIDACTAANVAWTVSYPGQDPVIRKIVAAGLSMTNLKKAYLVGDAQTLIADWADTNCKGDWSVIKNAMETKDFATAEQKVETK